MRSLPRAPSPAGDLDVVTRCRQGDTGAWRALYDQYAPVVHRFLSAFGVPPDEREDACQEVFVAVYRSLGRFRGEARLSTWIYRIPAPRARRAMQRRRLHALLSTRLLREPAAPPAPDPSER